MDPNNSVIKRLWCIDYRIHIIRKRHLGLAIATFKSGVALISIGFHNGILLDVNFSRMLARYVNVSTIFLKIRPSSIHDPCIV